MKSRSSLCLFTTLTLLTLLAPPGASLNKAAGAGSPFGPKGPQPVGGEWPPSSIVFVCHVTKPTSVAGVSDQLTKAIEHLKPEQSFNVIVFTPKGELTRLFPDAPAKANGEHKRAATGFIGKMQATSKDTIPVPALAAALHQKPEVIYFLSDAASLNEKMPQTIAKLNTGKAQAAINTIQLNDPSESTRTVLKKIASDSGGTYRSVDAIETDHPPTTKPAPGK